MFRDPFDEFRRLEMLIQKLLESGVPGKVSKSGVSIQRNGDKTRIDVRGDVPNSVIRRLKRKHPNAEISVESKGGRPPKSSDTVVEEVEESEMEGHPEEVSSRKLALKRFRKKKKERQHEGSSAEEGESE